MQVNLLIVDDHMSIIEGYKSILSFNKSGYIINATTANCLESAYAILSDSTRKTQFDLVLVDYTLPEYTEKGLRTGEDLIPIVRKFSPQSKVVMLTSHSETILLYRILNESKPEGLLVKSDFTAEEFLVAFDILMSGENYYTSTVLRCKKEVVIGNKIFDHYNRQIIFLLSQGVKTKNIQEQLHLSKSAVDKRKSMIKDLLGIDKGSDEDILREARKQGLI